MTGRRLYDHYCDSTANTYAYSATATVLASTHAKPIAWPFLSDRDRRVWNDLARRVTPKKRVAR